MKRHACGQGCGCQGGHEDSTQVVWHDPTAYSLTKHGPPYLKLSSNQKAVVKAHMAHPEVREVLARQAAYYDTLDRTQEPLRPLSWVLASMRTLAFGHQTHHWQTRGGHFYGDHLLFQRLYEDSLPLIDQVAEKAVGTGSINLVEARRQIDNMQKMVHLVCSQFPGTEDPAQQMVLKSLFGETLFLGFLGDVIDVMGRDGTLSHGTSNLLEGVADKHEEFVYLLKQRADQESPYTYDRR